MYGVCGRGGKSNVVMRGSGKHGGFRQSQHFSPLDNTDLPFTNKEITPREKCSTVVSGKLASKSRSQSSRNCYTCHDSLTTGIVLCLGCDNLYHFQCEKLSKELFMENVKADPPIKGTPCENMHIHFLAVLDSLGSKLMKKKKKVQILM